MTNDELHTELGKVNQARKNQELEESLMKMPELEQGEERGSVEIHQDRPDEHEVAPIIKEIFKEKDELIHKRMNDINTFQAHENEVYLRGTDEYGKDFQICFDSYNFLEWIDEEHLEYIKKQLTKYINTK
jgi:hypothetical protein